MKEDFRPSDLQKGGLQIFSSRKDKRSKSLKHPGLSSFTYPFLSSEETLSDGTSVDSGIGLLNQWKRLSDKMNLEPLNDYSPTVVNSEIFPKQYTSDDDARIKNWNSVINEVFKELPFDTKDQFLEEFQYAVISSDCLNDLNGNRFPCSLKKSIMDFHKRSHSINEATALTIATKYGRLRVSPTSKFQLIKTLDYLRTIFVSFKTLRFLQKLKSKNDRSIGKILSTLLMLIYLAVQQEYFYVQYTRYKTLITLKETLKNLQEFTVLLSKYHLKFKEIAIYKPFASDYVNNGTGDVLSSLRDLLSSSLDLFFYKTKIITTNLLAVTNPIILTKYCEIYALHTSDLFYYFNKPANEIEEKAKRFHILKKFMLCCLISLNQSHLPNDFPLHSTLSQVFSDCGTNIGENPYISDTERLKSVTESLRELNAFIVSLNSSLISHKSILFFAEDFSRSSSSPETQKATKIHPNNNVLSEPRNCYQISMTLSVLKRLQDALIQSPGSKISAETEEYVTTSLQRLLSIWQEEEHREKMNTKVSPIVPSNRGFSLDVLQSPTAHISDVISDKKAYLQSKINFKKVDETHSDIDIDSDHERPNIPIDVLPARITKSDCRDNKFQGLSDEELRGRLNEGILKFAAENNHGRERLRTQKSFELLRKVTPKDSTSQYGSRPSSFRGVNGTYMSNMTSRSPCKAKFPSEESIPVLYELQELLETH